MAPMNLQFANSAAVSSLARTPMVDSLIPSAVSGSTSLYFEQNYALNFGAENIHFALTWNSNKKSNHIKAFIIFAVLRRSM